MGPRILSDPNNGIMEKHCANCTARMPDRAPKRIKIHVPNADSPTQVALFQRNPLPCILVQTG